MTPDRPSAHTISLLRSLALSSWPFVVGRPPGSKAGEDEHGADDGHVAAPASMWPDNGVGEVGGEHEGEGEATEGEDPSSSML